MQPFSSANASAIITATRQDKNKPQAVPPLPMRQAGQAGGGQEAGVDTAGSPRTQPARGTSGTATGVPPASAALANSRAIPL